jgi:hypothetical protein
MQAIEKLTTFLRILALENGDPRKAHERRLSRT